MLNKFFVLLILFIFTINANSKDSITLQLDWLNQFQFAGYYVAKEKGFYTNKNLDVQIKEFEYNLDITNSVLNNSAAYGVGKSSLILEKLEGKDIILLFSIFQNSPMVLISTSDDITKINDLKNKSIMITNDAKSTASILAMLKSNGIEEKDIKILPHSFNLDDLINNKTESMACYISNEPFLLNEKNIKHTIFDPQKYGFDFYEGILYTSKKELLENPQRVKNIYDATLQGWEYAFNNIEETAKLIYDKYNTQKKSLDALIFEGKELKKLALKEDIKLGNISIEKIKEIRRIYTILGFNHIKDYDYLNMVYNPNEIQLSSKEKDFIKNNKIHYINKNDIKPFTINSNDEVQGIEIDYLKILEKNLSTNFEKKFITNIIDENEFSKINPNSFKFTYNLKENINNNSTEKISEIKIGIATLWDKGFIENLSMLEGENIAIIKNSPILEKLKKTYPKINFIETRSIDESINLLLDKKVFATIARLPTLSYYINNNGLTNIKISGTLPFSIEVKLTLLNENPILLNILNKAIKNVSDNEKYKINTKYNVVKYETHIDYSFLYKIGIPLCLIILIITIINLKLKKEITKRKEIENKLFEQANIDALTEIYNRRKISELYENEIIRTQRYETKLSIIFFDIDYFKEINDKYGHHTGDEVLVELSKIVIKHLRKVDYFGRWGGDEFLIVLPETEKEKAQIVVEHIKINLKNTNKSIPSFSCSFGLAQYMKNDTSDSLLKRVDNEMYSIKKRRKES